MHISSIKVLCKIDVTDMTLEFDSCCGTLGFERGWNTNYGACKY